MLKRAAASMLFLFLVSGMYSTVQSQQVNVGGDWSTSYGPMTMTQYGENVTATYGGSDPGQLTGILKGYTLHFKWTGNDGSSGRGVFNISVDGGNFTGSWGMGVSETDGGDWTGTKLN